MSEKERKLTQSYWKEETSGTLIEEFPAIPQFGKREGYEHRKIDGVIVYGKGCQLIEKREALEVDGERLRFPGSTNPCKVRIKDKRIVVIQTKARPISMSLLGQALFSIHLMERFQPKSIESVAICTKGDSVLEGFAEKYDIKVVVYPPNPAKV